MRKLLLNEYLKSILSRRGLPEPKKKEELSVGIEAEHRIDVQAFPSFAGREKGRLKRKAKGKKKHGRR
ncbi:hypothetical protein ACFLTV_00035 [Chloroflexota bacterium]